MTTPRKRKKVSIVIAIPSGGMWHAEFGMNLAMLMAHLMAVPLPNTEGQSVRITNTKGSLLPKSREELIKGAQHFDADYMVFLDTDQTFPRDTVHRLFEHNKPVVAANIATKMLPAGATARKKSGDYPMGEVVYTDPGMEGLEEVWRIGTGIMLINMSVFKSIKPPYFEVLYKESADGSPGNYVGEDWYFCEKLEKRGIKIYIDHGLSQVVGHIGYLEYTHALVGEQVDAENHVQSAEAIEDQWSGRGTVES